MRRIAMRVLAAICDSAVGKPRESLACNGRSRAIAHEALARGVVVRADPDFGVQIEPVEIDRIASEARGLVVIAVGALKWRLAIELVEEAPLNRDVRAGVEHVGIGRIAVGTTIETATRASKTRRFSGG